MINLKHQASGEVIRLSGYVHPSVNELILDAASRIFPVDGFDLTLKLREASDAIKVDAVESSRARTA